jgi:hypothetical protein
MKKIYKNFFSLCLGLSITAGVYAQSINEGFENITTLTASGWVQNNLSSPVGTTGWIQGDATSPFVAQNGAGFIAANYQNTAGTEISNWLITPSRTFTNGDVVTFYTRTTTPGGTVYPDRLEVRLSVNGTSSNVGATNTSVGDFSTLLLSINPTLSTTGYPSVWTQYTITVAGLPAPSTGRMAFRYFVTNGGTTGSNSDYIGIDDFVYTPFGAPTAPDVTVTSTPHPYTIVPLPQVTALQLTARVNNVGTAATTDAMLTANVYQAPNFTTPIQSFSSPAATIANGANTLLNVGTYTPSAIGDYMIQYISSCTNNTISSLDTSSYMFSVSGNEYARDNGVVAGSFGIGAGPTGYIASAFQVNSTTNLDSVLIGLIKPGTSNLSGDGVGDSTKVTIFSSAAGLPTTIIGNSPKYVFTPADTLGLVLSTHTISAIGGGSLILSPGVYFVAVTEYNTNVGLANSNNVFSNNTVIASWTGQAWTAVEAFGATFAKTPVIRPFLNSCAPTASSQTLSLCAGQSVTVGTNTYTSTGTYTDVLTSVSGCDSTVTTNLTVAGAIVGSQTLSLCAGQSVTVGTNTYTSTGTYTDVLTSVSGCDSTVTTNLTVSSAIVGSQTLSLCAGQSVTVGTNTYTSTGTYTDILTALNGCDSTVTTNLTVGSALDLTTSTLNETITSNATGVTYQWLDCNNANVAIAGETNQSYTATVNGNYAVVVIDGSCSDTSACVAINTVGIKQNAKNFGVNVYPNPSNGVFTIQGLPVGTNIEIYNAIGEVVLKLESNTTRTKIDLQDKANGVYFVKTNNLVTLKLVKQD